MIQEKFIAPYPSSQVAILLYVPFSMLFNKHWRKIHRNNLIGPLIFALFTLTIWPQWTFLFFILYYLGGGSNAVGMFYEFLKDAREIELVGVEAAGEGLDKRHAASLTLGTPGVLHGAMTKLLQNEDGQVQEAHSISAGLDYPGVGPEHCYFQELGLVSYTSTTDSEALAALETLAKTEGIICALESAHAMNYAITRAPSMPKEAIIVVNLSGRGDKDMETIIQRLYPETR